MIRNPPISQIEEELDVGHREISLDLETTGLKSWRDRIDLIAIKTLWSEYVLEAERYSKTELILLFSKLRDYCDVVILHNAKFDLGFIYYHYGVLLKNAHCTEVTAEICENGRQKLLRKETPKPFSLVNVLKRWLNITHQSKEDKAELQKSFTTDKLVERKKKAKLTGIPLEEIRQAINKTKYRRTQMEYAMEDVRHLPTLYKAEMERIAELGLDIIYQLEMKLLPVLVKMEVMGCPIDRVGWEQLIKVYWEPELKRIELQLDEEVNKLLNGRTFTYTTKRRLGDLDQLDLFGSASSTSLAADNELNYSSQPQLVELIQFLGAPVPMDGYGEKPSLEEEPLLVYLTENPTSEIAEFIRLLLEQRKVSKLLSTYGISFLSRLDESGNIHTEYTQTKTENGRLSSKGPNLQNIPRPPKDNPEMDIRRFFIAPNGYKFITCDMEGAEIAIAADYSQEPLLLGSIRDGVDMHSKLASISYSIIFGFPVTISKKGAITVDGKTYDLDELRTTHKSVVFAKFYKGGAKRVYGVLSEYINRHCAAKDRLKIANEISKALDKEMPVLNEYLSKIITQAQRKGFLRTSSFNRIRWFTPDVFGEAANAPISGTNADATKMAMVNIDRRFEEEGLDARLVLTCHDEVNPIASDKDAERAAQITQEEMAKALSYFLTTIKGKASVKIDTKWTK